MPAGFCIQHGSVAVLPLPDRRPVMSVSTSFIAAAIQYRLCRLFPPHPDQGRLLRQVRRGVHSAGARRRRCTRCGWLTRRSAARMNSSANCGASASISRGGRRRCITRRACRGIWAAARSTLKREDLNHTGAHKINHCMGEGLLAKHMGKKKIIAETGAGQHGVALATAAAYFGLECDIYMGEVDIAKQAPNVARMKILGTRVIPVTRGQRTLKEAVDACLEAYMEDSVNQIYCIGSVVGPHPFPMMVRDFQRVVGVEAREQIHRDDRQPARHRHRLRRRRQQRDGPVLGISRRPVRDPRRRTARQGPAAGRAFGHPHLRQGRHDPRLSLLPAAGRQGRAGRGAFGGQRPRLPRRRPRALPPDGRRPGAIHDRHRRSRRSRPSSC